MLEALTMMNLFLKFSYYVTHKLSTKISIMSLWFWKQIVRRKYYKKKDDD